MLYDEKLKHVMLDILEQRVSSIADSITVLNAEGFVPNKRKKVVLDWGMILLHAYENIDVLTEEQHHKLDIIYNNVIRM